MKSQKIVYFVNCSSFFCSHFLNLALSKKSEGYDIHIISGNSDMRELLESKDMSFYNINMTRSGKNIIKECILLYKCFKLIKKIKPNILHSFTIKPVIYGGIINAFTNYIKDNYIASITGLGFVFINTDEISNFKFKCVKNSFKLALNKQNTKVIFENNNDKTTFIELGISEGHNSFIVDGAGVDCGVFKPVYSESELLRVTVLARLLKDKGINEAIEAGKFLLESNIPAKIYLVGDCDKNNPASMDELDIKTADQKGYITWLGYKKNITEVYQNTDIALLPSYREGLPKSLIEALCCGKPVITTDVPGCREIVHPFKNGFLVPAKESLPIYEAIKYFIDNPKDVEIMGEVSRRLAETKFDLKIILNTFNHIYDA
jgi:glycosyltransferase involved in cell wall biosynthesis